MALLPCFHGRRNCSKKAKKVGSVYDPTKLVAVRKYFPRSEGTAGVIAVTLVSRA